MSGVIQQQKPVLQKAGDAIVDVTKAVIDEAGNKQLQALSPKGKGVIITWWILLVAIFIYMIVLAIIYYNEYTKFKYDEASQEWRYYNDKTNPNKYEVWAELTDEEKITWNIHKTVMNGLLTFMNLFGIFIVLFGFGSLEKPEQDICGSNQLGWLCLLNVIWFIVNMVWDIKNSQFTSTATTDDTGTGTGTSDNATTNPPQSGTETFCGMMETFCGSITEGFANVSKKLRKF